MNTVAILACLWVLCATLVAFLPMRLQFIPGVTLLGAAPVLIFWVGVAYGGWLALGALAAFLSMFRNPLIYLFRRLKGQPPEISK